MSAKRMRFESLLEAVPDALVGMDQKGVIRFVNSQTELLFGYDRDELIGQPISVLVPETLWQVYLEHRDLYFADPRTRSSGLDVDVSGRHHNGGGFPIHVSLSHIDTGDVLLVITAAGDVARQRQAVRIAGLTTAVVEYSDDAIVGTTLEGTITSWNPAAERMYGYSGKEALGRSIGLLTPSDRAGETTAALARIRAGQHVAHLKTDRTRKDGTAVPVSITVAPIRGEDDAVIGASAVYRDMTERVRADRALAETSRQYRLLAENAADFVAQMSTDGVITWVSPSVTRTLGWAYADLLGTRLVDLVHPDDVAATAAVIGAAYSGRAPTPADGFLMRVRAKSGQYRWMSGTGTPVANESGVRVGVVSGLRDVDDLVHARGVAEKAEAALRATADSLLDPHVRLDAVRDQSGKIVNFIYVDANPAACAYNGLDYQDLVGAQLLDLQPGNVGAGLLDQYRHVVETGQPLVQDDFVYAQELMGGQERRYDVRAARVGDGLSYTWRDVTDRHTAAMWLAESQEHYRLLAENASDVVMRLSPERSYEWVSGSIADVLGWAATDLLGHVIDEFIHPDDLESFRHTIATTSPESSASSELRLRRSDGSYRWVHCHTRLNVQEDRTSMALIGGLVDIEARKVAEAKELARLETLERFQRLTVGRELKMIELETEIERLRGLLHIDADEDADTP